MDYAQFGIKSEYFLAFYKYTLLVQIICILYEYKKAQNAMFAKTERIFV